MYPIKGASMITNKKHFFLLLTLLLVLAACSGDGEGPELSGAVLPTEPAATVAAAVEPAESSAPAQGQAPEVDAPTLEPTPTEAQAVTESDPETAETQPTEPVAETVTEEAPPAEAQFNGTYESTYFRGSATAAVTLIDYSDFL
jgi:hypothetical protein